jgi:ribonuclease J
MLFGRNVTQIATSPRRYSHSDRSISLLRGMLSRRAASFSKASGAGRKEPPPHGGIWPPHFVQNLRILRAMEPLRIVPLGGLGEVGKNLMAYELGDEIVVVDAGLAFPRDEHLGVDLVLPDFSYLRDRADRVRAVLLTHAHEDHVGALPYLLREVSIPEVWGTRLTLGLVQPKLDEHGLSHATDLREARPEDGVADIGPFRAEWVRMAHSVPDTVAIVLEAGGLRVLHTGDYKLDHTPVDGLRTDVGKLAEIGNRGVDLLLGDSTNAERPGVTGSERLVGEAFRQIIPVREGRILVACFASNVHRMQHAVDVAVETGRKVCVIGRSMRKNLNIARNLGYLEAPDDTFIRPPELEELAPREVLVLCTGSQGEPLSALTRIAYNDHPAVTVERGDTVILSAKPVPGNELRVHDTINHLAKSGAEVLHQEIAPVHVSGHGNSEELRTVLGLVRPKAVMPVHGEFRMLAAHAQLARESGVPAGSIVLAENGSVVELDGGGPRIVDRVETGVTFVDGLGVGDVRDVALRDRRHLSEHGVLIVVATVGPNGARPTGSPELIARGFGETEPLVDEMRTEAARVLDECLEQDVSEIKLLQEHLHDALAQLVYDRTGRRPMILPVIVEV